MNSMQSESEQTGRHHIEFMELSMRIIFKAGRKDLIGFGPKCLIKPRNINTSAYQSPKKKGEKTAKKKTIRNIHKKKDFSGHTALQQT